MSPVALWLCAVLLVGSTVALDVPFVFDETSSGVASYNSDQIEQAHISSPDLAGVPTVTQVADNDVLDFPITGGGIIPVGTIEKNVGDIKKTLDAAVEPDNPRVREEALVLALMYPGDLTVDQIASIYSYLKNGDGSKKGWGYVRDPRGLDYLKFSYSVRAKHFNKMRSFIHLAIGSCRKLREKQPLPGPLETLLFPGNWSLS